LGAQEAIFKLDGQLGKDGKAQAQVPAVEGQQLVFRVASLDFPARIRLSLNGQDFIGEPENLAVTSRYLHVRKSGTVQVTIESSQAAGAGSFQLRVQRVRETVSLGKTGVLKGSILRSDQHEGRNRFMDWYPLPVSKGQHLLIGVSSRAADSLLRVELPDGAVLENDDSLGSDSRVQVDVAESGIAWVGAGVLVKDEQLRDGLAIPYQVYVRDFQIQAKPVSLGQAGPWLPFVPVADDLPPLPEYYSFVAAKAGVYRFRMDGRDGTVPLLRATTDTGRRLAENGERSSRDFMQIRCYLRQNQRLDLVAESLPGGSHQHYSLSAQYESPGIVLHDGDNLERSLQDPRQGFFVYHGKAGEYVEFLMTSDEFETRLLASDVQGQLFAWSKYYGSDFSYASLGGYWFEQAGDLLLETGSRSPGDDGLYQISVHSSASGGLELPRETPNRTPLSAGTAFFYRLTDQNPAGRDGYQSEFQMDLKAADLVSVRLQSWDVETRLLVIGPDGQELAASDEIPVKDNTLELLAPKSGRYLVRCLVPLAEGRALNATATVVYNLLGTAVPLDADLVNRVVDLAISPERPSGERNPSDGLFTDLTLRLRSPQHLYAVVDALDFQPGLKLLDKDGLVVDENHGLGMKGRARIDFSVQKGGIYRLRIVKPGAVSLPGQANPRCTVSVYEIR
jgi:hypothetical protein